MTPLTLYWEGKTPWGTLKILDQTLLPGKEIYIGCENYNSVIHAIETLKVRGAPAIGVAAAYGMVLAMRYETSLPKEAFLLAFEFHKKRLAETRPTAVNLFTALETMQGSIQTDSLRSIDLLNDLFLAACKYHQEDQLMCQKIGRYGAELLGDKASIMTHCNAGALATTGSGTALAPIYEAARQGKEPTVWVKETRPLLQGSRITAWELGRAAIPSIVICDSAAGHIIANENISAIFVGADRIALNGDTANKIGTYPLALIAQRHKVPFYVVAPSTTFDLSCSNGGQIPIEDRHEEEIRIMEGRKVVPDFVSTRNPAFDITPADLITAIITNKGIIHPVTVDAILQKLAYPD
jgi:methylthioribose-1-phosphate isomerase